MALHACCPKVGQADPCENFECLPVNKGTFQCFQNQRGVLPRHSRSLFLAVQSGEHSLVKSWGSIFLLLRKLLVGDSAVGVAPLIL